MIQCPHCMSYNYFQPMISDVEAWECWNCFGYQWISDEIKQDYMFFNGLTAEEADQRLRDGLPIFMSGQCVPY